MSIALTSTWQPRGELARLQRYHTRLAALFETITVVLPPEEPETLFTALRSLEGVLPVVAEPWARGRHIALEAALIGEASHLLYCDLDRMIRWIEVHPDELADVTARASITDCLVIGRTDFAWNTHPRALRDTERIVNEVFKFVVGLPYDICVAARGMSRAAAQYVLAHSQVPNSLGVDGEWLYLLHRAGVPFDYVQVDGMEWETADQWRDTAANADIQRRAAEAFDADPARWPQRVHIAQQIIDALLRIANSEKTAQIVTEVE